MKRLVHIWLLLFIAVLAMAQQRKDSIKILFPDAYTATIDSGYLNTSQVLDSIVASLALPQNAERHIYLSSMTPHEGVDSLYKGGDSLVANRLQSVALVLKQIGVQDTLIHFSTDSCNVSCTSNDSITATLSAPQEGVWLYMPGGIFLGTGTYDIYQAAPDSTALSPSGSSGSPSLTSSTSATSPSSPSSPTSLTSTPKSSRLSSHSSSPSASSHSSSPSSPSHTSHASPSPKTTPKNSINNNARIMDSLRLLVSAQQDTIAQYRQQIADLSQRTAQIVETQAADSNRNLYLIIALLLALLLLLLGVLLYGRRRRSADKHHAGDLYEQLQAAKAEVIVMKDELAKSQSELAKSKAEMVKVKENVNVAPVVQEAVAPAAQVAAPTSSNDSAVSFDGIYSGKSLYESVVDGSCHSVAGWGAIEVRNFIEYYRLQHREFVDSLDTDYHNLSRNHKVFMVLLDMGKSDPEIQKLMGITQTTIRSIRFRIKAKRKDANGTEDTQTTIQF